MNGALLLTAARTPYRRAGLSFPVGAPLTVAILALGVGQLRQLLEDPAVTVMVGQDNGQFMVVPELTAEVTDEQLQAFIDAAPGVELEAIPPAPVDASQDVGSLRHMLDERSAALGVANDQLVIAQDQVRRLTGDLAAARDDLEGATSQVAALQAANQQLSDELVKVEGAASDRQAQIADLQAALDKAKKPAAKAKAADE
ncbi:hypothetical protein N6H05_20995 [Sphingobium sp. WTD-1]|uniref:hypothetical protein n=1 Tax=Sphingobium sp. WTD-1 TaxID=2979467 RepID=UPI0024DEB066|nr:hypothetical protein [Sphingobium sp. WTD-1]WIA55480.1 hypothetical protein N6H05_20995 [Sphingobium sp. WTD-1]